ncbi:MAG: hypothetical protein ABSF81_10025 [Bacteroidales bacterium]|jgi:hypothetical protein
MNEIVDPITKSLEAIERILQLVHDRPELIKVLNIIFLLIGFLLVMCFAYLFTKLIFDRSMKRLIENNIKTLGAVEELLRVLL